MKIAIATGNRNKFEEITLVLKEYGIKTEQVPVSMKEEGENIEEVALDKVRQAWEKIKKPLIVDDTGVFFLAYKDFPGRYAKRYYEELGLHGLLKRLEGKSREAYFKTIIAFTDGNEIKMFEGVMRGRIIETPGEITRMQFPYEAIFIPDGMNKTVSELSLEEKIRISHRAKAARKLAEYLINEYDNSG